MILGKKLISACNFTVVLSVNAMDLPLVVLSYGVNFLLSIYGVHH